MDDSSVEVNNGKKRKLYVIDDDDETPRIMQLQSRLGIASEF